MGFVNRKKPAEEKVLDMDASMQGSLNFKDPINLRINGEFHGSMETRGSLTIGPQAVVEADIIGDNIIIGGKIRGKITARERLTLLPSAIVEGDIYPTKLNIAEGAILEGCCSMLHDYMSSEELARYLEVDLNSVLEWASSGKMPGHKEGRAWRFDRKAIDSWVASGKVGKKGSFMSEEKFLTVREVALILGATEKNILDLAEKGQLPAYRIGGVYLRFKKEQILEYKKTHAPISLHTAQTGNTTFRDKVMDFLYLNDFYILAFSVIAALLVFIFRGD